MALPLEKVLKRWREQFSWLDITNSKTLICKICCLLEDKLPSMPNVSMSFISESSNYQSSALKDHDNSACHQHAIHEKEHEEAVAVGKSLPPRKFQHLPLTSESPIYLGIQQMSEKDRETLSKLLSYRVTKTSVYSLSKSSCVRETSWCKVYRRL